MSVNEEQVKKILLELKQGLVVDPLPEPPAWDTSVPHAPRRPISLTAQECKV
jgi:hypothetical protein